VTTAPYAIDPSHFLSPTQRSIRALSLHQPWASLVALGVKSIETRSWSTKYRGPLAIHAAKTLKGIDALDGEQESGWRFGYVGDFQAAYCFHTSDEGDRGDTMLADLRPPHLVPPSIADPVPMPLGAVVAICELVDCVPMVDVLTGDGPDDHEAHRTALYLLPEAIEVVDRFTYSDDPGHSRDVTEQRPYGDFRAGRWAWLLADITAVDPPVSAIGRQGLFEVAL
jgi:hypothetical protein